MVLQFPRLWISYHKIQFPDGSAVLTYLLVFQKDWPAHQLAQHDFVQALKVVSQALVRGRQRSEEHTSELQSRPHLVCRLLLEKKNSTRLLSTVTATTPASFPRRRARQSGFTSPSKPHGTRANTARPPAF